MNQLATLHKIKWTIFLTHGDKLSLFTQCIEKLVASIDKNRTEIILLGKQDNKLLLETFSYFCESKDISYNYGDSTAHAFELAQGQYIVFLTDHTIVSKQFLVKLAFAMENADKPHSKTAIVAPTSNEVAPELNITPYNIDALQAGLSRQQIPYDYTMKLSPFCVMAKKEVCNPNLNVREIILQANYNGYLTVSANDCLVYHYNEEIDEAVNTNFINPNQKLAVLYRVKIDNDFIRDVFVESLQKSLTFADNVYALDANSRVKTGLYLREKYPDLWSKITVYHKESRPYDERQDYNDLISWAEADGCTWMLSLEADEVVEDKVTEKYLERFLNPVNPEIFAYRVSHYHFYDSSTLWRIDKPWGQMQDIRLARLFPGRRITREGLVAGQCGYVPGMPADSVRDSGIRIKNYGYVQKEDREAKKAFYDKIGVKQNGQTPDFKYLTNTNGMHRYEWNENSTVTFYTPVRVGGDNLWAWLDSIAYLADEILVGNDSDALTPDDIALVESYKNAKVVPTVMGDNFADGRNRIIKHATSSWIYQLDVDETIDSLCAIRRLMDVPQFDAWLFSITNIQKDGSKIITETMRLFRNVAGIEYWGRLHETIDAASKKLGFKVSRSPVKMGHFGYTMQSDEQLYEKMQRYLSINLKQMKETPSHGMAYYSTALHFLDDNLVEDAIKLLEICTFLMPAFPLAGLELGRNYLRKGQRWINRSLPNVGDQHPLKQGFMTLQQHLDKLITHNHVVARGHCIGFFNIHADERKWLRDHIIAMEKRIEEEKTKIMERRAKG